MPTTSPCKLFSRLACMSRSGRQVQLRQLSSSSRVQDTPISSRWLSDTKARLGKCIHFGMNDAQVTTASSILILLSRDWLTLLAGSEGFTARPIASQPINWGSQDAMGHVNNVQYVRYCETSRTNWTKDLAIYDPPNRQKWFDMLSNRGTGLILKSIKVDYKFPMTWPDRISVYHKIREMPRAGDSSMLLDVLVVSEGKQRVAARAEEDVVAYDYKAGRKSMLPEFMLEQFRRQFAEQEEAKEVNTRKVQDILGRVRALEQDTWDRPDAKEDTGGA